MTTSQPGCPDHADPAEPEFFSVAALEAIAKVTVRAAQPADRHAMWIAFEAALRTAAEQSPDRMPWEDWREVRRIAEQAAIRPLKLMIETVDDLAEQKRLAAIVAREAERAEQADGAAAAVPAGKYPSRHCAGCGKVYRPKAAGSSYCSHACRQAAYRARQAAWGNVTT